MTTFARPEIDARAGKIVRCIVVVGASPAVQAKIGDFITWSVFYFEKKKRPRITSVLKLRIALDVLLYVMFTITNLSRQSQKMVPTIFFLVKSITFIL